jgi:hypothetical protein
MHQFCTLLTLAGALGSISAARIDLPSKEGLALIGDLEDEDVSLLTSENSPISWYYTWSPWPWDSVDESTVFLPLIPGLDTLEDSQTWDILEDLPSSSTHLLTFNEPDEKEANGGNKMSPKDAAEAYLEYIVPLRDGSGSGSSSRTWNISHPVVSGSERGLDWLRDFNESCYDLDDGGCPTDFVSVHWYGEFAGLQSWLETLHDFYNPDNTSDIQLWVTEMALPQEDEDANVAMLEESMRYLDGLGYVAGYAWFGAFRAGDHNEWTGEGVSLLDEDGGLTELGSAYLGGNTEDFATGEGGAEEDGAGRRGFSVLGFCLAWAVVLAAV